MNTGLGWEQLLGMVLGGAFTFVLLVIYAWARHRCKVALNERPPQQTKILRPAGHTLQCRLKNLSESSDCALIHSALAGMLIGIMMSLFCPLITGLALHRFTYDQIHGSSNFGYFLASLFLLFSATLWMAASLIKTIQIQRGLKNCQFGLRGEQAVAEALADAAVVAAGYVSFHDVPGDGEWNIDHIVLGPAGIFVLETKTRPRRRAIKNQLEHEVWFDGKNLQFPWCYDRRAVAQVERNVQWVRKFIAGFSPEGIIVQPIIVVPGWYVRQLNSEGSVKAMNASYLSKYLTAPSPKAWTAFELRPLVRRFDERCRDLQF